MQERNRFSDYQFYQFFWRVVFSTSYAILHGSTPTLTTTAGDDWWSPSHSTHRFCCWRVVLQADSCCASAPWSVDMIAPALKVGHFLYSAPFISLRTWLHCGERETKVNLILALNCYNIWIIVNVFRKVIIHDLWVKTVGWHISSVINVILLTFWVYLFQVQGCSIT